jgi:hypothetical protein
MNGVCERHQQKESQDHAADHGHRPFHGQAPIGSEVAIGPNMPDVPKYKQQDGINKNIGYQEYGLHGALTANECVDQPTYS